MNLQPYLKNELIKLKPLSTNDFEVLFNIAADPDIWEQHPDNLRYERDVFQKYFDSAIESKGAFLIIDNNTNEIIGSSRYYDFDETKKEIAIGYTFISTKYWGTNYNKTKKKLMLDNAFRYVEKVLFHIGENNIRSQKAVKKLGAILIGKKDKSLTYAITKIDWQNK
jgi:RimJ/RimL family protein N-acetyltransferase